MSHGPTSWTCPYCNQVATIQPANISNERHVFSQGNKYGHMGLFTEVVVCPNGSCREFTVTGVLYQLNVKPGGYTIEGEPFMQWALRPQSSAKAFPSYIPASILQDYKEACLIRDLSPKASATLSRRCLQGMIRDFWHIKKGRLIDEINALKEKVDRATWRAIDAVRSIGNIGAHMEKDINVIVDVDSKEASLLIGLIEVLLEEWYIRQHEREQHMHEIISAAEEKSVAKGGLKDPSGSNG